MELRYTRELSDFLHYLGKLGTNDFNREISLEKKAIWYSTLSKEEIDYYESLA